MASKSWKHCIDVHKCTSILYTNLRVSVEFSKLGKLGIYVLCYTMPSRDLCKIHEGMFDKPEGVARGFITHSRVFLHRSHGMAWYS